MLRCAFLFVCVCVLVRGTADLHDLFVYMCVVTIVRWLVKRRMTSMSKHFDSRSDRHHSGIAYLVK